MYKIIFCWIAAIFFLHSCGTAHYEKLIEAESFGEKGGWVVDPQFVEQMGSPYLLAHGLGIPVKNARTVIRLSEKGRYYIWVRTKNWAPGDWSAPGRFILSVDGNKMGVLLGTGGDWDWQYAGKTKYIESEVTLELNDLTGFDGRCDAIYMSTSKMKPPAGGDELKNWRKTRLNESESPEEVHNYDLVVTGGGIAGCAASIAAAEKGLKVALVHDRPVLGGNASSEIRVHTEGITWKADRILKMLNTVWWPNGSPDAMQDDNKRHQIWKIC